MMGPADIVKCQRLSVGTRLHCYPVIADYQLVAMQTVGNRHSVSGDIRSAATCCHRVFKPRQYFHRISCFAIPSLKQKTDS